MRIILIKSFNGLLFSLLGIFLLLGALPKDLAAKDNEENVDLLMINWTAEFALVETLEKKWAKLQSLKDQIEKVFSVANEEDIKKVVSHQKALRALKWAQYAEALQPIWSRGSADKVSSEKEQIKNEIVSQVQSAGDLGQWPRPTLMAVEVLSLLASDSSLKNLKSHELLPADE